MIDATYIDHMGSDLTVVNAARVSFGKHKDVLDASDEKLIAFLARNGHFTPFTHPQITLRIKAPIFVARQCMKSQVGFTVNEVSRRYVDSDPEFYQPIAWRMRAADKKQGSSDIPVLTVKLDDETWATPALLAEDCYRTCLETYNVLLAGGVAPEQARMVLPQAMMTEWYWTGSLAAWARFFGLRAAEDAQEETRVVAWGAAVVLEKLFPVCWAALTA